MLYLTNQKFFFSPDDSGSGGASGTPPAADNAPAPDGNGAGGQGQDDLPDWVKDPKKAYEAIKKDREDAKSKRELAQRLEAELATLRQKEAEALKAKGDFEKLYGQIEPEYQTLKAQAEQFKAYQAAFDEMFKARMKDVPPHIKSLLEGMEPLKAMKWIEDNADKLKPPPAPDLDSGKRGGNQNGYLGSKEHVDNAMRKLRLKRQ